MPEDLDEAITFFTAAKKTANPTDPSYCVILSDLAMCWSDRGLRTQSRADLEQGLAAFELVLQALATQPNEECRQSCQEDPFTMSSDMDDATKVILTTSSNNGG